jgi:hypothetical protein
MLKRRLLRKVIQTMLEKGRLRKRKIQESRTMKKKKRRWKPTILTDKSLKKPKSTSP